MSKRIWIYGKTSFRNTLMEISRMIRYACAKIRLCIPYKGLVTGRSHQKFQQKSQKAKKATTTLSVICQDSLQGFLCAFVVTMSQNSPRSLLETFFLFMQEKRRCKLKKLYLSERVCLPDVQSHQRHWTLTEEDHVSAQYSVQNSRPQQKIRVLNHVKFTIT